MNDPTFERQLIEELKKQVRDFETLTNNLISLIGCKEYIIHQREVKIKELEARINRLKWQFPSDN